MNKNKNIFFIVLASLAILMIAPCISAEATNNEHWNAGKVIDVPEHSRIVELDNGMIRYDHVHREKGKELFINDAITPDGSINDYYLMGAEWFKAEPFVVNPSKSSLDEGEISTIIGTSLNTWDKKTSFNLFGDTSIDYSVRRAKYDEKNSVTFKNLGKGIIGVAYTWYYPPPRSEIVESDVVFSTRYTWSTSDICPSNAMDLQNIATHEFGHSAGLRDLYEPGHSDLTMYGYSDYGETKKQSLEAGDIAGIHAIYGM